MLKVFKGKKMPGRMGGKQRTVKNVWVYKIEPQRNLMWVRGQVSQSDVITDSLSSLSSPSSTVGSYNTYLSHEFF